MRHAKPLLRMPPWRIGRRSRRCTYCPCFGAADSPRVATGATAATSPQSSLTIAVIVSGCRTISCGAGVPRVQYSRDGRTTKLQCSSWTAAWFDFRSWFAAAKRPAIAMAGRTGRRELHGRRTSSPRDATRLPSGAPSESGKAIVPNRCPRTGISITPSVVGPAFCWDLLDHAMCPAYDCNGEEMPGASLRSPCA